MIVENDLGNDLLDPPTNEGVIDSGMDADNSSDPIADDSSVEPGLDTDPTPSAEPEYDSVWEEYLASRGIKGGNTVTYDDGEGNLTEVRFDELDREEQLNILNELSKPNLTDHEMQAVQYLRDNNATLNDVIHYFQQKAVEDYISANTIQKTYSVDDYSDDELFIADLKMKYPDMDDAELEADLILAKSNEELFKKKADIIRNNYKAIEDKQIQDAKAAEEQSYQDFKASLSNALQNFEEISLDYTDPSSDSLAIEDSEREAISSYILSVDENGVSQFAKDLQDPQKLVNFGWYALYGKDAISGISQYWKGIVKESRKAVEPTKPKAPKAHVIPTKEDMSKKGDMTVASLWSGKI